MTNKKLNSNCLKCGKPISKDFLFCDKICHGQFKTKNWNRSYIPKGSSTETYKK